jgi:tripartite-type tricarboxylate transporter receptor subunit TctC
MFHREMPYALLRRAVLLGALLCATSLLCAASMLCAASTAVAQSWPGTTPIRFETTASAGGLTDIVPRTLAPYLSAAFGVPVVVENRPGAGGNIAAALVARTQPDGHTLLVTGSNHAVNPMLVPNPGFDYERDFAPVAMVASAPMLLVAAPDFPAKDINDVIRLARQKPKSVSIAISVIGTPGHLAAEMLAQYGNIDLIFVPYEGSIQAVPDLLSGRVNLAVGAISTFLPQIRAGTLKTLAMVTPQRSPLAPDIPTAADAGLPALQIDNWICFMTTGGTPAPIVARLDAAIAEALALPEVHDAFAKQGIETLHMNPERLDQFMKSEAERYRSLLEHSRVKGGQQ